MRSAKRLLIWTGGGWLLVAAAVLGLFDQRSVQFAFNGVAAALAGLILAFVTGLVGVAKARRGLKDDYSHAGRVVLRLHAASVVGVVLVVLSFV